MSEITKERIREALQQVKQEGKNRAENIREIIKNAVYQAAIEAKNGTVELRTIVKDIIAEALETFQDKGEEIQEDIKASLEGVVEGISQQRRKAIVQNQTEVKQLEAQIDSQEQELQAEIDGILTEVNETGRDRNEKIKTSLDSAIHTIRDSDEVALLRRRYAQLKAQLAVVQANLSERYGENFEDVKHYLDEAKIWYERAKEHPEVFTDKVEQKRAEVESKLSEAGSAAARKERQIKQILRELWKAITESFHDKEHK